MFSKFVMTLGKVGVAAGALANAILPAAVQGQAGAPDDRVSTISSKEFTPELAAGTEIPPSAVRSSDEGDAIPAVAPLPSLESSDIQTLLLKKLGLCCMLFDFTDPSKNMTQKQMKTNTLLELVGYMPSGAGTFTEAITDEFFRMISLNLFRPIPQSGHGHDDKVLAMDPSWCHLRPVYEILTLYVDSSHIDLTAARTYIDQLFVLCLLNLFDSPYPPEREMLKTILLHIYSKFTVHRPFIRNAINNIFYRFTMETERQNGISELLENYGRIISGFTLPLKEEHKIFLVRALMPLHKPKCIAKYHKELSYCVVQFAQKDLKLTHTLIKGLLKYWPVTSSQKEVLFLEEVEAVLEVTGPEQFQCCMIPLFRQIGRSLSSPHFQVAERALFFLKNDHIVDLVAQNRHVVLPLIIGSLEKNTSSHWNRGVSRLTVDIRKKFLDLDQELFWTCQKEYQEKEERAKGVEDRRKRTWRQLEAFATLRSLEAEQDKGLLLTNVRMTPQKGLKAFGVLW